MANIFPISNRLRIILIFVSVFSCNFIFGLAAFVYKLFLNEISPFILAMYRQLGATPIFILIALVSKEPFPALHDVPYLVLMGFMGVFLSQTLFVLSVQLIGIILTSILLLLMIPMLSVLSILANLERWTWLKVIALAGALGGALVIVLGQGGFSKEGIASNMLIGIGINFLQALSFAGWIVLAKKKMFHKYSVAMVNASMHVLALPWIIILNVSLEHDSWVPYIITSRTVIPVLFAIFVHSILGYITLNHANANLDGSLCASFCAVVPLTGTLLAVIFRHETLKYYHILGAFIIISSLFCIVYQRRLDTRSSSTTSSGKINLGLIGDDDLYQDYSLVIVDEDSAGNKMKEHLNYHHQSITDEDIKGDGTLREKVNCGVNDIAVNANVERKTIY